MYQQIKILEDEDKALCLLPTTDYSFSATYNQVPLAYYELFKASASYPIMFLKKEDKSYTAVAFLSLETGTNLYVTSTKSYEPGIYKPTYFTRFPFIYANLNNTLTFAYDTKSTLLNEKSGEALFDVKGEPTELLNKKIEELNRYQLGIQEISDIIKALDDAGVLVTATEPLSFGENYLNLNGFMYIDEVKLNNLPEKTLLSLTNKGAYKAAIAQLISLNNFESLVLKQNKQGN